MRRTLVALIVILAVAAVAGLWRLSVTGTSRNDVLKALVDDVIVPDYVAFDGHAGQLQTATDSFCATPSAATLVQAQDAWKLARHSWKLAEAHNFGPAKRLRLDSAIDFWPLRPWLIDAELAKTSTVDAAYLQSLGNAVRGLPAIEYLLFSDIGQTLTTSNASQRTCAYLRGVAGSLRTAAADLLTAWQGDGGFGRELATAGAGSETYARVMDGINALVNQFVGLARTIEDAKLGRPLGKRYGNMPQVEAMESSISRLGAADLLANVQGMRRLFVGDGKRPLGIGDLIPADQRQVRDSVALALDNLERAVRDLTPDLATVAEKAMPSGEEAFKQSVALSHLLQADLVSVLGVTPTFSDNDGD